MRIRYSVESLARKGHYWNSGHVFDRTSIGAQTGEVLILDQFKTLVFPQEKSQ
jgi:hypothetical protein